MELINEPLPGLLELKLTVHSDNRGLFCETFNERALRQFGVAANFVQDNESRSTAVGTVRGLHFQVDPFEQGKLVRVLGAISMLLSICAPNHPRIFNTQSSNSQKMTSASSGYRLASPTVSAPLRLTQRFHIARQASTTARLSAQSAGTTRIMG